MSGESDGENAGYTPAGRKNETTVGNIRQNSYLHLKKEQEKEPAIKLKVFSINSMQSKEHLKRLV